VQVDEIGPAVTRVADHFGRFARFAELGRRASAALTERLTGWRPSWTTSAGRPTTATNDRPVQADDNRTRGMPPVVLSAAVHSASNLPAACNQ
jgi:hypothetical protein